MNRFKSTSRWALWSFVAALLLRAAMPLLANASAEMRGVTMVEVCSVYGVSMVPLDHHGSGHLPDHAPDPAADHGSEHCALTALTALAAPSIPVFSAAPVPRIATAPPRAQPSPQAPDACATWVARLKHGPPALA